MQLSRILFRIALSLLPLAVISTTWLYLYPIFHHCAFPRPPSPFSSSRGQSIAPFRLLALGDPQLEGDSSLPNPNALVFPSLEYLIPHLRNASSLEERGGILLRTGTGVVNDARKWLEGKRKAIDLWGNDWYLAHIVRSLRWWTEPTHISVLGDLLGSQWVTDGEFRKRTGRYWDIVMSGLDHIPTHVFGGSEKEEDDMITESDTLSKPDEALDDKLVNGSESAGKRNEELDEGSTSSGTAQEQEEEEEEEEDEHVDTVAERQRMWGGTTETLGADASWAKRVINIAGNHDIGYAGDIDQSRIERFERAFGSVNWDIWFTLPIPNQSDQTEPQPTGTHSAADNQPALRLVILNSMNLDTPAWASDLQVETYDFVNYIITTSRPVTDKTHATLLLTHIPLEKETGICVDSPYFDFFEGGQGVKEQNMLSDHASKIVLEGIFGMSSNKDAAGEGQGRRGLVLNGHDHAGCDVVHYIRQPGVEDLCQTSKIESHLAYWPSRTREDESIPTTASELPLMEVCEVSLPQDANHVFREQCPMPSRTEHMTEQEAVIEEVDSPPTWKARRFPPLPYDVDERSECTTIDQTPHMREITLRSMMGEYSGYAGFLSAWFNESLGEKGEWEFEFNTCGIGIQHWWWGVHILLLIVCASFVAGCMVSIYEVVVSLNSSSSLNESPTKQNEHAVGSAYDPSHKAGTTARMPVDI